MTAPQVAQALAHGLKTVWPQAKLTLCPLSDGGDGLLDVLAKRQDGAFCTHVVCGPYGLPVTAAYWRSNDGRTAYVETARASGLALSTERDPLRATSFGTGELCKRALESGIEQLYIGAGGSAFVDGGAGALEALGFKLLDAQNRPIARGCAGLRDLDHIETPSSLWPQTQICVLCDVENPLLGPNGAAACYGPQKGATPEQIPTLEAGLAQFARCLKAAFGRDPSALKHSGASGGLAGSLAVTLDARLVPGADFLAKQFYFDEALQSCDLVISAEGQIDHQSHFGKVTGYILEQARRRGRPVWLFGGHVTAEAEARTLDAACFPLPDGPMTLEESIARAPELLTRAVTRAARLWRMRLQEQDSRL